MYVEISLSGCVLYSLVNWKNEMKSKLFGGFWLTDVMCICVVHSINGES